ncbi:hypothetical protein ACLOJK_009228 [Asimina triloba]
MPRGRNKTRVKNAGFDSGCDGGKPPLVSTTTESRCRRMCNGIAGFTRTTGEEKHGKAWRDVGVAGRRLLSGEAKEACASQHRPPMTTKEELLFRHLQLVSLRYYR